MEQSCEDKNIISLNNKTIEICMNDLSMEDKFEENLSVQTKASRIEKGYMFKENFGTSWKNNLMLGLLLCKTCDY